MFGLRPASVAVISSISWCLLMGQPRSSKSTGTCSAIGVESFSVLMYFGVAYTNANKFIYILPVSQSLDAAGRGTGPDGDQLSCTAAELPGSAGRRGKW